MDGLQALCGALLLCLCAGAGWFAGRACAKREVDSRLEAFTAAQAETKRKDGKPSEAQQLVNLLMYDGTPQEDRHGGE